MGFQIHFQEPRIYQVHDRVYLEQELRIKPPTSGDLLKGPNSLFNLLLFEAKYMLRRSLSVELPAIVDSLFADGAELAKVEAFPSSFVVKMEKKCLILSGSHLTKGPNAIKLAMQFILPPDKFYNFISSQLLERAKKDKGYAFTFLIKNKKDWPIEYVKMYLQILTKEALKKVNLFGIDLETHERCGPLAETSKATISYFDKFKPLDSKTYLLEIEFQSRIDPDAQMDVYVNDSSLTKAESIVFIPGEMLESLKRFYDLLGTLENDIWWFDQHIDKDCFDFLSNGINKKKVANIRIIGGPIHVNEQFKQFCKVFKTDMASHGINVEIKVILDERTLERLHGRFLFDQSKLYTIPPSNIVTKKFDAVVLISSISDSQKIRDKIQEIWKNSTPISNWKKIVQKRESLIPKSAF